MQVCISSEAPETKAKILWKNALEKVVSRIPSSHYRNQQKVPSAQHMSSVDVFDGSSARKGEPCEYVVKEASEDLLIVSPQLDGRLKDVGRSE